MHFSLLVMAVFRFNSHLQAALSVFLITVVIFTLPIRWAEQSRYWLSPSCLWKQINVKKINKIETMHWVLMSARTTPIKIII